MFRKYFLAHFGQRMASTVCEERSKEKCEKYCNQFEGTGQLLFKTASNKPWSLSLFRQSQMMEHLFSLYFRMTFQWDYKWLFFLTSTNAPQTLNDTFDKKIPNETKK